MYKSIFILFILLLSSCETPLIKGFINVTIKSQKNTSKSETTDLFSLDTISRISERKNTGTESNSWSDGASISENGKVIAFVTNANLSSLDTNNHNDVYIYNRDSESFTLVSIAYDSSSGNNDSNYPIISSTGTLVMFNSYATNLVAGDTNSTQDVFVRDLINETTVRINLHSDGTQANNMSTVGSFSDDGRYAVFTSNASNLVPGDTSIQDVFLHDFQTSTTTRISQHPSGTNGNSTSTTALISGNGQFIAFNSYASNLITGDTNGKVDTFVYDRIANSLELISISTGGVQSNGSQTFVRDISSDGRYVLFTSNATNLVAGDTNTATDAFIRDRVLNTTELVSFNYLGNQITSGVTHAKMSDNGRLIAFESKSLDVMASDNNSLGDVYLYNRDDLSVTRISQKTDGTQDNFDAGSMTFSRDGSTFAFYFC